MPSRPSATGPRDDISGDVETLFGTKSSNGACRSYDRSVGPALVLGYFVLNPHRRPPRTPNSHFAFGGALAPLGST